MVHTRLEVHTWLLVEVEQGGRLLEVVVVEVEELQQHNRLGQQLGTEQGIHMLVQLVQLGQLVLAVI